MSINEPEIQTAISRGVEVLGDIELFAQRVNAPVLAITGSNGKSTVTGMVSDMASKAGFNVKAGGNLGEPALDLLDPANKDKFIYVLELSSFQLETTYSLSAQLAAVLNISADHMDRYGSLQAYADAKARIYHNAHARITNRDDSLVRSMVADCTTSLGVSAPEDDECKTSNGYVAAGDEYYRPVSYVCLACTTPSMH